MKQSIIDRIASLQKELNKDTGVARTNVGIALDLCYENELTFLIRLLDELDKVKNIIL